MTTLNEQGQPVHSVEGTTYLADEIELHARPDGTYEIRLKEGGAVVGVTAAPLEQVDIADPVVGGAPLLAYEPHTGKNIRILGNTLGGILVNDRMPSKAPHASKVHYVSPGIVTASGVLFAPGQFGWLVGEHLHVVESDITGLNSSTSAITHYVLRDGGAAGPIKFRHIGSQAQGTLGSVPRDFHDGHTYKEHPIFETDVYLEIISGTLQIAANIFGYSFH